MLSASAKQIIAANKHLFTNILTMRTSIQFTCCLLLFHFLSTPLQAQEWDEDLYAKIKEKAANGEDVTADCAELAKKYTIDESGFINGILGSVVRDKEGAK